MCELWVHWTYDHLYIPVTCKKKTILGDNNNPFPITSIIAQIKIFERTHQKKLILPLEKYFKTSKDIILGPVDT